MTILHPSGAAPSAAAFPYTIRVVSEPEVNDTCEGKIRLPMKVVDQATGEDLTAKQEAAPADAG